MNVKKHIEFIYWRQYKDTSYIISSNGKVYNFKKNRIVKGSIKNGYYNVFLLKKNNRVHRLVATIYIKNPLNKPIVNHKDGNKLNNNISNLEWVTYKENSIHAVNNNLIKRNSKFNKIFNYDLSNGKKIKDFETYYVFPNGNIYNTKSKILLKPTIKNDNYQHVGLSKNGKKTDFLVHILVANTFISKPSDKTFINHKDGNKSNNNISNLEWVTNSENILHALNIGLINTRNVIFDFIIQYNLDNKEIEKFNSITEASRHTNINRNSITKACNGIYKTAGSYIWKYIKNNNIVKIENVKVENVKVEENKVFIIQFNLNNVEIAKYNSICEASIKTNIYKKGISNVCNGYKKTAGGYIWKFSNNKINGKNSSIIQYNLENEKINRYKNITEASIKTKIDSSSIYKVCNNKQKTAGGFNWKYE